VIDLTNLKAPAWQRVVADLSAPADDDHAFLTRLVAILGQVAGSRQAVLFTMDAGAAEGGTPEPRPMIVWPPPAGHGPGEPTLELGAEARSAAVAAVESGQVRAFGLDKEDAFYDGSSGQGYLVSVPIHAGPGGGEAPITPRAAVTLLIEPRSRSALQTTMALVEVLAGYTHAHGARQQLRRTRAAGAALDLAERLIAAVNLAAGFRGAALQLCNDLARQLKVDRVALGWVRGIGESGAVRIEALSDTEHLDRRLAMVQKIEAAMDECLDQEQPVLYPPPPESGAGADAVLANAITHAHRELTASDARLRAASLPLRCEADGEHRIVGVVTIESADGGPIDGGSVELLQAALDLVAPLLRLRRSDDRNLGLRAWASARRAGSWLVGVKHTGWKLAGLAALAAGVGVTVVNVPYRVGAPAEIQPRERRVVSMPYDGVIASLGEGVEPGKQVKAGEVLCVLETTELRLASQESLARIVQADREADLARRQGKQSEAKQAEARADAERARLATARYRIEQAEVRAPIDGRIIEGDLRDRIGAALHLGDGLFKIAPLEDLLIVARVGDRDIALIHEGGRGWVATKADPARAYPITIERIVPLAQSKEGTNAFEVRARLDAAPADMLPGTEGLARLDVGRHSLLWIGTRRIRDALRLWLWW
jgi:hypothetical protein